MTCSKKNPATLAACGVLRSERPARKLNSQFKPHAHHPQAIRTDFVEEGVVDRERLVGALQVAQAAGDFYHIRALRLVLKRFDERARASRLGRAG